LRCRVSRPARQRRRRAAARDRWRIGRSGAVSRDARGVGCPSRRARA
jgi:hypothetical protein